MAEVMLKNPDAPATPRQLYRLHMLTGEDTRDWQVTMQQASETIEKLEKHKPIVNKPLSPTVSAVPFTEAKVTIIEGEQGSGKTNTAVARVVDAYDRDCVAIYCRDVLKIDCKVVAYYRSPRVAKIKQNGVVKLIKIPSTHKLRSPMRIFANFHLYGIPYVFCPSYHQIVDWLRTDVIREGFLLLDEHYIGGNAREGMKVISRELVKQSFQFRKMRLQVLIMTPNARLIDWTTRTIPTEHINCSCDNNRGKITLDIKKKGQKGIKQVPFDGSIYWGNFFTEERINQ